MTKMAKWPKATVMEMLLESSSTDEDNDKIKSSRPASFRKVCDGKIFRPLLFDTFKDSPSLIPIISRTFTKFSWRKYMPYAILNSKSFVRGFAYLMCVLPLDCPRIKLYIWQQYDNNGCWIQHIEVAIEKVDEDMSEDERVSYVDLLFHYFVDEDKSPFVSLRVLSYEEHRFRIELDKSHVVVETGKGRDCCSFRNKRACQQHMYPRCYFYPLQGRETRPCPTCGSVLCDLIVDFADVQIWSFKYITPNHEEEDDDDDFDIEDVEFED